MLKLKSIILVLILASFLWPHGGLFAAQENLQTACQSQNLDQAEKSLPQSAYRQLLRNCLNYYNQYYDVQEKVYQGQLKKTQTSRRTLESELNYLKSKIGSLTARIQRSNIIVRDLNLEIKDKADSINVTQNRISRYRQELADFIQLAYQYDKQPVALELLADNANLSDIFRNFAVVDSLNERIQELLQGAENLKAYLKRQQDLKEAEKEKLQQEIVLQSFQKNDLLSTRSEKDSLLKKTKGQEALYQEQLAKVKAEAQKKVQDIRARLFRLIDIPKGGIEFGQAVTIAENVSKMTGVKPAFLLAILAQESSERIGANVGGCYLTNPKTGDGIYIKSGKRAPRTMKPTRDVPLFMQLTKQLGRNYQETPVSCCIFRNGRPWGWGGAMGPAQFIPSTWNLFADQVKALLHKKTVANPWSVQDSFLAAALYLKKLGANGTYRGELNASLGYFGCSSAWCVVHYGRPVLERTKKYENEINIIHQAE